VGLSVRVTNTVRLGFSVRDDVTDEVDVFEAFMVKVGLRVNLTVRVIYELDVVVFVDALVDD
jgi:hypothetical protein